MHHEMNKYYLFSHCKITMVVLSLLMKEQNTDTRSDTGIEVERVASLQNLAGSGYFKNSRTGPGRAGYTRSVEKLDNNQCSKQ